ncbi:MAG: hypothetical protein ACJ71F_10860 [Nitrososphaeraceae archaeon]
MKKLKNYKSGKYSLLSMFNKHTTALYAAVIASVLVASVFAISYVQQALAQGNQTGGAAGGTNQSSSSNSTSSGGAATGGSTSGSSGSSNYWTTIQ